MGKMAKHKGSNHGREGGKKELVRICTKQTMIASGVCVRTRGKGHAEGT